MHRNPELAIRKTKKQKNVCLTPVARTNLHRKVTGQQRKLKKSKRQPSLNLSATTSFWTKIATCPNSLPTPEYNHKRCIHAMSRLSLQSLEIARYSKNCKKNKRIRDILSRTVPSEDTINIRCRTWAKNKRWWQWKTHRKNDEFNIRTELHS